MAKDYSKLDKDGLLKVIEKLESRKKYGLVWDEENTKEKFEKESENALPILKEVKVKEIKTDANKPTNILIEGDNYHALSVLNYTHPGKIDVIYIDPPYNTGKKDFVYNDDYVDEEDTYKHSKWLSFMSKRLRLAKNLLTDDGILAVSIDDHEIAQLKLLLDELFNENTKVVAVKMSEASGLKMGATRKVGNIPKYKEYVIFAKKYGIKNLRFDPIKKAIWDNEYNIFIDNFSKKDREKINQISAKEEISIDDLNFLDSTILSKIELVSVSQAIKKAGLKDEKTILNWKLDNAWRIARTAASSSVKNITDAKKKNTKQKIFSVISKRDNLLYIVKSDYNEESRKPRVQLIFADDNLESHPGDIWTDIKTTGLEAEGNVDFKNGKKPLDLIRRIVYSSYNDDAIVCDFFAGSGTTGEATLELNKLFGGNRQFILCTYNKENNNGNIADQYCYPRIKNAINGYRKKEKLGGNLKYFKTGFVKNSIGRDDLKIRITHECTEMLCLREGIFDKVANKANYQIFQQNGRIMAIYYSLERDSLGQLKKELDKMKGQKILYCFTLDPLGLDKNDFVEWNGVSLEPIPQKILDIYEQIYEY